MSFNPIRELKQLVAEIEGKVPTEIENELRKKVEYLKENEITDTMHVGRTAWTQKTAAEWLLSMFIGIVEKAKDDSRIYISFGTWLHHSYHFVIDNKAGLAEE